MQHLYRSWYKDQHVQKNKDKNTPHTAEALYNKKSGITQNAIP